RMTRVVIGDDRMREREPFVAALGHALCGRDLDDGCAHVGLLLREMLAEKREYLAPAIHRLLGPIEWPMPIEKAVARNIVTVGLVGLAVLLELVLVLIHLLGARRTVVVAEQAEQRAREVLRHVDRGDWGFGIELLLAHHDAAAPQLDAGIHILPLAGIDEGVPPA